jgi:endonuclease YncB( thermonuclease family)
MKPILAVLAASAALSTATAPAAAQDKCGPLPGPFEGLAFAGDGDTLYGLGYAPPIRLWGVQAPELRDKASGQEAAAGMRARAALEDALQASAHRATCTPRKFDRYCRVVATCTTTGQGGSVDLALALLRAGLAYGFWLADATDGDMSLAYAAAEAEARRQRRGLWKGWLGE